MSFWQSDLYDLMMAESPGKDDRCWAHSLGDCAGPISLEHYVSECIFPDREVTVKGFPWLNGETKSVRIETLGRNMLCKEHNSELSPLDASMAQMLRTLEKSADLIDARRTLRNRHWTRYRFVIDARLLERWCLKTLLNVSYRRELNVNLTDPNLSIPVEELVRIAFGRSEFNAPAGLYIKAKANDTVSLRVGIGIRTTISDKGELVGGSFDLFGFKYLAGRYSYDRRFSVIAQGCEDGFPNQRR
jgi:hypothetical protein